METKRYSVLIIDDHPLIIDSYKTALKIYSHQKESIAFSIQTAEDCDSGIKLINEFAKNEKNFPLFF